MTLNEQQKYLIKCYVDLQRRKFDSKELRPDYTSTLGAAVVVTSEISDARWSKVKGDVAIAQVYGRIKIVVEQNVHDAEGNPVGGKGGDSLIVTLRVLNGATDAASLMNTAVLVRNYLTELGVAVDEPDRDDLMPLPIWFHDNQYDND